MGKHADIEWCDSTLNPQMGCDGCELWNRTQGNRLCYAGQLTDRWGGKPGWPEAFEKPKLFLDRLQELERWPDLRGTARADKPWLDGMPRLVFMCDMGDPWTESLPLDWLAPHLDRLAALPHILIWLTKRPHRARQFFTANPAPKNFWLLASVTSQANIHRLDELLATPGISVRGCSYEPALGAVTVPASRLAGSRLGWLICGGASRAGAAPMNPDWARQARDRAVGSGVPFFFKQWGPHAAGRLLDGREWNQMPEVRS